MDFDWNGDEEGLRAAKQLKKFFREFHQCAIQSLLPEFEELKKILTEKNYNPELNIDKVLEGLFKTISLRFTLPKGPICSITADRLYIGNGKGRVIFIFETASGMKTELRGYAIEKINRQLVKEILSVFFQKSHSL